jgi:hypothetical protein
LFPVPYWFPWVSYPHYLHNTFVYLAFQSSINDKQGECNTGTNRITVEKSGVYVVFGEVNYSALSAGQIAGAAIGLNGAVVTHHDNRVTGSTAGNATTAAVLFLDSNDYVQLYGYAHSTASKNVDGQIGLAKIA